MKSQPRLWVAIVSTVMVIGLGPGQAKQKYKDKHTVRMGELLVAVTSVEAGLFNRRSDSPHRIFAVHVRIQNLGKQFPCTALEAYLVVEPFYQYPASLEGQPSTYELLPGETAEGRYSFDIRDGTVPEELLLKAKDSRDERCVEHPDWGSVWHYRSEARIPIEGLPVETEPARAVISPRTPAERPLGLKSQPIPLVVTEQKGEVRQQPGNTIVMDDGFEYRIVDYGAGQVQLRPALSDRDALSQPVFWIEFRITNASEHLLGVSRYSPSETGALAVVDNWGNDYQAWCPFVKAIWSQATLPLPPRKLDRYKPQESALDLAVIPLEEFVKGTVELHVYLNRYPGDRDWHFFSLHEPMLRRKNLLRGQIEPSGSQLAVSIGEEVPSAFHPPR